MMKCGAIITRRPLRLLEVEDIALETYDVAGLTPLHKAVGFGHPGCLRRLLENGGMDPNICTGEVTIPAEFEPAPSRYEMALHVASRLLTRAINSPDGAGSSEQQQEQQREIMQAGAWECLRCVWGAWEFRVCFVQSCFLEVD